MTVKKRSATKRQQEISIELTRRLRRLRADDPAAFDAVMVILDRMTVEK